MYDLKKDRQALRAIFIVCVVAIFAVILGAAVAEGQTLELCEDYTEAPFCSGPSMQECPTGTEVPETEECNSNSDGEFEWLECPDGTQPNEHNQCPVPVNQAKEDCLDAGGKWMPEPQVCIDEEPATAECPMEDRSARGYCPGTGEHQAEIDQVFEHEQTTREGSCELDGTCDDSCSPPARSDCTHELVTTPDSEVTTAPEPTELADTGMSDTQALLLVAVGAIVVGIATILSVRSRP